METDAGRDKRARLNAVIWSARFALFWERLWPAMWPVAGVAGLLFSLAFLDILPLLPVWLHFAVLAGFAGAVGWAGWRGFRLLRFPAETEARRRVELESGLKHRPLTGLDDTLAGSGGTESDRLWEIHRNRLAGALQDLRAGPPRPDLARRDPLALRAALLLLLCVAVVSGAGDMRHRLQSAFLPSYQSTATAQQTVLDIWISPPDYTGLPPVFPLRKSAVKSEKTEEEAATDQEAEDAAPALPALEIPAGSTVTAQVQGAKETPVLVMAPAKVETGTAAAGLLREEFDRVDEINSRIVRTIPNDGILAIEADGITLARWQVTVIPDNKPKIEFTEPPTATPQATMRVAFTASDDYGIKKARMEIRRTYEKGEVIGKETVTLDLPLPGEDIRDAKEAAFFDLSPHKWAGAPVIMELVAEDGTGQTGRSKPVKAKLPTRQFVHPVAREIVAQRKKLFDDGPDRRDVILGLRNIVNQPRTFGEDVVVYLGLTSAASRLIHERQETALQPVVDLLWDTALRLEDGRLSIAEREMRRLQQALMKALAEGASQEELDRLMRQLQAAIQRYMQALAEQMRRNPQSVKEVEFDPKTMRMMSQSDIHRMMQQIQEMMRAGNREGARQMLARLQQMLANMRSMQVIRSRGGRMGRQAGALRQLQQLIQRQQQLMDRTFQFGRPGGTPQGRMPSPADQRALQEMLRNLRGSMQGQNGQGPGQFMDRAMRSMEQAIRALQGNRPNDAVGAQGQALQNLRQAGQRLMQQLRERFARQSGQGQRPRGQARPLQDPLGRDIDEGDGFDDSTVNIDAPNALKRTREILDELRRRSGERFRPRIELDYIDRLLDWF